MSTPLQLAMGVDAPHRNQYLFSDHYLNHLLPADPRWPEAWAEAEAFLAWLRERYAREQAHLPRYAESQLEEHWFKPILSRLGHVFEGQAGVPGLEHGVKRPDYVFFPDEAARQAAVGAQRTADYVAHALAAGEVKRWDVPLGKKQAEGGASFEAQNPSWQIDYYLRATGLAWGILSNGRLWRLVQRDTSQRLSIYYEVDLVDLLSRGDPGPLRYFTLFFHQAAFRPDPHGRVFLDDALQASRDYALALEEDLRENAYRALERLMQGFLDLPGNRLGPDDLRLIYDNSLHLLYRLLFILYAESRGLLPLEREAYREHYSLRDIQRDIASDNAPTAPMTTLLWGRLRTLFHIINGDEPELNRHLGVPRYNGGLFNPGLHPFLEEKAVGDRALREAIDLLSRRASAAGREFVDYRTLGVRHLGSIYEGLLEYQPRYAGQPMVAVRDGKGERWVERLPRSSETSEVSKVIDQRDAGQVYLETDRGERKATGSYYTPQYIVEYIVKNTLGPLVEEARGRVKARARGARGKAARAMAEQSLIDEILNLKVLDPAMGSAHFLVEATEFLALALATDPYVQSGSPAEEDLAHWRRRVVERCIYGVDRNPLAVELAKLSLWLATVAADRPLSFLDHHLKCGDSLVGARVDDLGWPPPAVLSRQAQRQAAQQRAGQVNIFQHLLSQQLPVVMGRILEITGVESDSYETVQAKEAADRAVRELKAPFEAVADLWASAYFGHSFTPGEYDEALGLIGRPGELLALPAVQRARELAGERRFFHWELAFPEVFYDRDGQPLGERAGFDAVVGNPPYGATFTKSEKTYLSSIFSSFQLDFDSYVFFLEMSQELTALGGRFSFITPEMWLRLETNEKLRRKLLSTATLESLWVSGKVFEDAVVYTCVPVFRNKPPDVGHLTTIALAEEVNLYEVTPTFSVVQTCWLDNVAARVDYLVSPELESLLEKITKNSLALGELCEIAQGLTAYDKYRGHDEATIKSRAFHADYKKGETFKRWLQGVNVYRYGLDWSDEWINYGPWLAAPRDPKIFSGPRLLFREVPGSNRRIQAQFTDEELYYGHSIIPCLARSDFQNYSLLFLLSLANSRLLSFYGRIRLPNFSKSAFPKLNPSDVQDLPIRRIEFTTPADERARLAEQGRTLYARFCENEDYANVLGFVGHQLSQQPERADVVHDLLVTLAGEMIAINREMHQETRGFLAWLEREAGASLEDLSGRTRVQNYLGDYQKGESHLAPDELLDILRHNRRRLRADPSARAFQTRLAEEYAASLERLLPLKARLAAADRLIDRIVYRLYGLTEEEIALVERGPGNTSR